MPLDQERVIDNLVDTFEENATHIVQEARRAVTRVLLEKLTITDGVVARTQGNMRVLHDVDALFARAMDQAGYSALVRQHVKAFNGQFEFFQQTLDRLGQQIGRDLTITFGARDKAAFAQAQIGAATVLEGVVDTVAMSAQRQAIFSVGGIKQSALIDAIITKLDETPGRATTLADTSLSMFYRTIADRGYSLVEGKLPEAIQVRYRYGGPNDKLTRPKCRQWLAQTAEKPFTRAQIDKLDNGQIPNVWLTCGGYNCRHQWIMVLTTEDKPAQVKTRQRRMPSGLGDQGQVEWLISEGSKYRQELSSRPFMKQLTRDVKLKSNRLARLDAESAALSQQVSDGYQTVDGVVRLSKPGLKARQRLDKVTSEVQALKQEVARIQRQIGDSVVLTMQPVEGWKLPQRSKFSNDAWEKGVPAFERLVGPVQGARFDVDGSPTAFSPSFKELGHRAHYDPETHTVYLGGDSPDRTAVHELGHWLDDTRPDIAQLAIKFREYRTRGEVAQKLQYLHPGRGYKEYEITKKDRFIRDYMGKQYWGNTSSEITSMGLEYLYAEAGTLYQQDPEYFDFMLGLIRQARGAVVEFDPWGKTK